VLNGVQPRTVAWRNSAILDGCNKQRQLIFMWHHLQELMTGTMHCLSVNRLTSGSGLFLAHMPPVHIGRKTEWVAERPWRRHEYKFRTLRNAELRNLCRSPVTIGTVKCDELDVLLLFLFLVGISLGRPRIRWNCDIISALVEANCEARGRSWLRMSFGRLLGSLDLLVPAPLRWLTIFR
jgi:hypothetical protein